MKKDDVTVAVLKEIRNEVRDLRAGVGRELSQMNGQIGELRTDVGVLRVDSAELRGEVGGLRGEVGGLRAEVGALRADSTELRAEVGAVHGDVREVRGGLREVRGEVQALRAETGDAIGELRDQVINRIVDSEIRISTVIAGLGGDVQGLARVTSDIRTRLTRCETDILALKSERAP